MVEHLAAGVPGLLSFGTSEMSTSGAGKLTQVRSRFHPSPLLRVNFGLNAF